MAKRALVLAFLIGCSATNGGVLGGGSGVGGAAGTAGGAADGGAGTGGTASCAGSASFYCLSGCSSDVGNQATCVGGEWGCPAPLIRSNTCTCIGYPPPGYICGPNGWVRVDGGAGGNGGTGGAGGGAGGRGGAGGAVDGGAGQGGLGGTHGNESCSPMGMSCAAPAWCCMGLTCQANVCVPAPDTDGGSDAATCSTTSGLTCLIGSCSNDVAMRPTCKEGAWICPAGTVDARSCGGCTGHPPPGWVCGDGGWAHDDAGGDGGGG